MVCNFDLRSSVCGVNHHDLATEEQRIVQAMARLRQPLGPQNQARRCVRGSASDGASALTPTCSSWLNQVELWFGQIERDVISRGVFSFVTDLKRKLMPYIRKYNDSPKAGEVGLP